MRLPDGSQEAILITRSPAMAGTTKWLKNHKLSEPSENRNIRPESSDAATSVVAGGVIFVILESAEYVFESWLPAATCRE